MRQLTLKAFHPTAQGCPTFVGLPWVGTPQSERTPARRGSTRVVLTHSPTGATPTGLVFFHFVQPRVVRRAPPRWAVVRPTLGWGVKRFQRRSPGSRGRSGSGIHDV